MRTKEDLYRAKLKEFKNGKIKLREYKTLLYKPKQKEATNDTANKRKRILIEGGKITKRSLSKTRITLMELVENNEGCFNSFITLTYADDVEDINTAYKDLRAYIKGCKRNLQKEGKELFYIAVPEIQHKRAKKYGKYVIHFHLITNIEMNSELIPERKPFTFYDKENKCRRIVKYYNIKYWSKGFSSALPIIKQGEFELSKYLVKYLYKDLDNRFYGRQKLLHSNNLKTPEYQYYLEKNEIEEIKKKNEKNIEEVFSMIEGQTNNPFIDITYKKKNDKISVID